MKTKYDWSGVPSWVNFLFRYENTVWGSNLEPRICEFSGNSWRFSGDGFKVEKIDCVVVFDGNWQDSLEERPND